MIVLISVKEAAERLGISKRTIQRWISQGRIEVAEWRTVFGGKSAFFDKSILDSFLMTGATGATQGATTATTATTDKLKNGGISTDFDEIASPALAMTGKKCAMTGSEAFAMTGATNGTSETKDIPERQNDTDDIAAKNGGISTNNDEIASPAPAMTGGEAFAMTGKKPAMTNGTGNVAQLIGQHSGSDAQRLRQAKIGGISGDFAVYEGDEWWLPAESIGQLLELPLRTVRDRIAKEKFSKIRRIGTAGSKGFRYEVGLSCLATRYKEQFYMNYDRDLNHIVEELHNKYGLRISYGQMRDPNLKRKLRIIGLARSGRGDRHYRRVAERFGVSKATVYRYMKQVREHRISGRQKKRMSTDEVLRIQPRSFDPAALDYAIGMILSNKWDLVTAKELYETFRMKAETNDWRIGSYDSFLRIIKNLAGNVKRIRDVDKISFVVNETPPIERDYTKFRIFEEFVGDQHKADYCCVDDENNLMTLELFCWMDMRSRLVFPAFSRAHYNKYTVGRSLCYAMELGIPEKIYTDWGKPERSNYLASLRASVAGVTSEDDIGGIGHKKAMVKRSRSKPIENYFRQMDQIWLNRRIPGYAKRLSDPAKNENMQRYVKKLYKKGKLLHYRDLMNVLIEEIEKWNNHIFVNAGPDTGRSPLGIYKKMIEKSSVAFFGETAAASREILRWFALPERRLLIRKHILRFKTDFFGVKKYLVGTNIVNQVAGDEKVIVKYDPYEPEAVFIVRENGQELLGQALRWGPVDPHDDEEIVRKIRIQKDILKYNDELLRRFTDKMQTDELRGVARKFSPAADAAKKAALISIRTAKRRQSSGAELDRALIAAAKRLNEGR